MLKLTLTSSSLALVALQIAACGRTTLDSYTPVIDAGPDAPLARTCSPSTCPDGCCDSQGQCRAGTARDACGALGAECTDCPRAGFPLCDATSRTCARTVEKCDASSCADGCCGIVNGNPVCLRGDQPGACGKAGVACQDCGDVGLACNALTGTCDGKPCDAETCADGCCLGNQCLRGLDDTTCGGGGFQCENCEATGRSCIADPRGGPGGVCTGAGSCNANNCSGCCLGDVCLPGGDSTACGRGAGQCASCGANQVCSGGQCVGTSNCADNCPGGCCIGNTCFPGNTTNACGFGGAECKNCAADSETCAGQQCQPVACNAQTCPNGCCDGDRCVVGDNAACGLNGGACSDCAARGEVCEVGACVTPCTPANCVGCCNGNRCEAGFLNGACGSNGVACVSCSAQNTSCDIDNLPRTCLDNTDCPATYAACANDVHTTELSRQQVCGGALLTQAASACANGPNTPGCNNFFEQLVASGAGACAGCLAPFRFPFNSFRGIANCASSFVDDDCNRDTGCMYDCEDKSCSGCAAAGGAACRQNVRVDQCGGFFQDGLTCVGRAVFLGGAGVCRPDRYGNNYGQWLAGVGGYYCAQ